MLGQDLLLHITSEAPGLYRVELRPTAGGEPLAQGRVEAPNLSRWIGEGKLRAAIGDGNSALILPADLEEFIRSKVEPHAAKAEARLARLQDFVTAHSQA